MKRIVFVLAILVCTVAFAATETINWYVDGNTYATTTCQTGGDITLPTTPIKRGYTFQGWKPEFTPIEYLESDGEEVIDTGLFAKVDCNIEIKYRVLSYKTYGYYNAPYGTSSIKDTGPSLRHLYDSTSSLLINGNIGAKYPNNVPPPVLNKDYVERLDINGWTINGNFYSKVETRTVDTPNTIHVFNSLYDNSIIQTYQQGLIGRVYYFKMWNNGLLVRDMIPVLDANGTPCMYDKVEKKFYYNAGTGNFIAGPVINQ